MATWNVLLFQRSFSQTERLNHVNLFIAWTCMTMHNRMHNRIGYSIKFIIRIYKWASDNTKPGTGIVKQEFWKFEKVWAKTLSQIRVHSSTLAEMSSAFLPKDFYTPNHTSLWSQIETEPFSDSFVELMAVEFDVVWVRRKLGFSAWLTHMGVSTKGLPPQGRCQHRKAVENLLVFPQTQHWKSIRFPGDLTAHSSLSDILCIAHGIRFLFYI